MTSEHEEDEELDEGFQEDMEALRRACILTGTNPEDVDSGNVSGEDNRLVPFASPSTTRLSTEDGDSEDDDLELLRKVQGRFCDSVEALPMPDPISIIPPLAEDDDDFETLLAVRRRFAAYDGVDNENLHADAESFHKMDFALTYMSFPESARLLIDAIKKNRACQRFLRNKLAHIVDRMKENKKLRVRVKILKDFQARCKTLSGKMFSVYQDPRIQLITPRTSLNKEFKIKDKNVAPKYRDAPENSQVANYRLILPHFARTLKQKPWSKAENEKLHKGLRQQFQEMLLKASVFEGQSETRDRVENLDHTVALIRDLEISPVRLREYIPKVNWDQLAFLYVQGRSGAECQSRWLNCEDPLIHHGPWTKQEEKKILLIVKEHGMTNWVNIAASLGTNRTPFDCLAHFQRSLNANILKQEWTKEEDDQLRAAVDLFGEGDWQSVASTLPGRTGSQCSNRWMKSLHPRQSRKGRWTQEEDRRLKVAVKLFGPKNWEKIAGFVPGRMQAQVRERWVNVLDPSLNWGEWTAEEDLMLKKGIEEFGYRWSKIAAQYLPRRTDNQCTRRWKALFPSDVPLLQTARRAKKAVFIGNFVDREEDRPALGPDDFVQLALIPPRDKVHSKKRAKALSKQGPATAKENGIVMSSPGKPSRKRRLRIPSNEGVDGVDGGGNHVLAGQPLTTSVNDDVPALPDAHPYTHGMITNDRNSLCLETMHSLRSCGRQVGKEQAVLALSNGDSINDCLDNMPIAAFLRILAKTKRLKQL